MKMIDWDDGFCGSVWYGVAVEEQRQTGRSQESHLISNHFEFIDYFSMRFLSVPPIMPPHVFPCQLTG